MTGDPAAAPHVDVARLRHHLAADGQRVEVRETHGSTVFLVGDRGYRLRKPVQFDFRDQRSAAKRAELARRDVFLNLALAPGVVLGVRAVVPAAEGDGYALGDEDDVDALDHVVEMRRFDEDRTMAALLRHGTLTTKQAHAAGVRLATFHRGAGRRPGGGDYRELVDRNFEALRPLADALLPGGEPLALQRFAAAFLDDWDGVLEARALAGSVVDGHGNLKAEHVLFEGEDVLVVDRLEFEALRVVDVADELSLLLMDLKEATGERTLGDAVLAGYKDAGGDVQPEALLAFFGAYRAQVRAKVALLRAKRSGGAERSSCRAHAERLFALSCRLAWQARGPLLILVTGHPATGTSPLARALGRTSGLPVLSADGAWRERGPEAPDDGSDRRAAAYADLARRVGQERAAIVDATFGDDELEQAFAEQLTDRGDAVSLVIECRAPADGRLAVASERRDRSDAGAPFVEIASIGDAANLAVDPRASLTAQVDEVSSRLDSILAAGNGG